MATGMLLFLGIAIHNFPEGLAMGAGLEQPEFGLEMALLIVLHDVPEGLAMSIPLKMAGVPGGRVILLATAAGLPTSIGAVVGVLLGSVSEALLSGVVAFGAGAMLYLTLRELIPEAWAAENRRDAVLALAGGAALGAAVIFLI